MAKGGAFLVTGGSRGLGLEFALDKLEKGHCVVLPMRPEAEEIWKHRFGARGYCALTFKADFGHPDFGRVLSEFLADSEKKVSRVLHAAGGGLGHKNPLLETWQFRELIEANLLGAVSVNRVVIPTMIEAGFGRIVHVGSTATTHAVGSVGYNASKAALGAYVRTLGREYVQQNVAVSGINPGAFEASNNSMARLRDTNPEAHAAFIANRLPLGKMMKTSDLCPLIDLLHGPTGLMMSGSMVAIDAGESLAYDT